MALQEDYDPINGLRSEDLLKSYLEWIDGTKVLLSRNKRDRLGADAIAVASLWVRIAPLNAVFPEIP